MEKVQLSKMLGSKDLELVFLASHLLATLTEEHCREIIPSGYKSVWTSSTEKYIFHKEGNNWILLLSSGILRIIPLYYLYVIKNANIVNIPIKNEDGKA